MNMQRKLRKLAVAVAVTAAFGLSGTALAVDEIEQNDSIATAQHLDMVPDGTGTGSATVNAVLGTSSGLPVLDVDFYSFDAKAGDVVTIDIDGGMSSQGASGPIELDTVLFFFGPDGKQLMPPSGFNDDGGVNDPGSPAPTGVQDALLTVTIPTTGTYTVAVTDVNVSVNPDGTYSPTQLNLNGTYTLTISGVSVNTPPPPPPPTGGTDPGTTTGGTDPGTTTGGTGGTTGGTGGTTGGTGGTPAPTVMSINIDIKPGERNAMVHSKGHVEVALLSSGDFNALNVDTRTLTFGATGNERSLRGCENHGEHVDRNRSRDLVCKFDMQRAGFAPGYRMAVLKGKMRDGKAFEGHAALTVRRDDEHRADSKR